MPNEEGARYICGEVIPESEFAALPLTPSASTKARRLEAAMEELAEADHRLYEARQRFYTAECAVYTVLDKIAAIEAEP